MLCRFLTILGCVQVSTVHISHQESLEEHGCEAALHATEAEATTRQRTAELRDKAIAAAAERRKDLDHSCRFLNIGLPAALLVCYITVLHHRSVVGVI